MKIKIKVKDIEIEAKSFNLNCSGKTVKAWVDYFWKLQTKKGEKE